MGLYFQMGKISSLIEFTREMWSSQRPYKRILVSPVALGLYLYHGQVEPFLHSCTLVNKDVIYLGSSKAGGVTINNEISKYPHRLLNKRQWDYHKDKCFKFVFVRSPYSFLVSTYMAFIKGKAAEGYYEGGSDSMNYFWGGVIANYPNLKNISFENFVKLVCNIPDHVADCHFLSRTGNWKRLGVEPDFIGKIENFDEDWNKINNIIGLGNAEKLKVKNKGSYDSDWIKYYNQELIDLVYERFKEDFQRFGYSKIKLKKVNNG